MIIKINGTLALAMEDYDKLHKSVIDNTQTIPEAIKNIPHNIDHSISNADWNQYDREGLNLFENFDNVQAYCGNNIMSWLDAFNYSVMDMNAPTKTLYNFIHSRSSIAREGFDKEGNNITELSQHYQETGHELTQSLLQSIGEHTADFLNFIGLFFI